MSRLAKQDPGPENTLVFAFRVTLSVALGAVFAAVAVLTWWRTNTINNAMLWTALLGFWGAALMLVTLINCRRVELLLRRRVSYESARADQSEAELTRVRRIRWNERTG